MKVFSHICYCLQGKGAHKQRKKLMLRKATKVHVYVQCFSCFFQALFLKFDTTVGYSYH